MEAKVFIVVVKRHNGLLRGFIEERRRSLSSWVGLGPVNLGFSLEGIEPNFRAKEEE